MQHALATERSYQTKGDLDIDSTDVILDACGNLIMEEQGFLRPVHFSVQEFFTNPPNETASALLYMKLLDWSAVHTTLASVCIKYLLLFLSPCKSSGDLWRRSEIMPFAFYAAHYFDSHIWEVMNPSSEILSLLDLLFMQSEAGLAATLQLILVPDDNVRRLVGRWLPTSQLLSFREHLRVCNTSI